MTYVIFLALSLATGHAQGRSPFEFYCKQIQSDSSVLNPIRNAGIGSHRDVTDQALGIKTQMQSSIKKKQDFEAFKAMMAPNKSLDFSDHHYAALYARLAIASCPPPDPASEAKGDHSTVWTNVSLAPRSREDSLRIVDDVLRGYSASPENPSNGETNR